MLQFRASRGGDFEPLAVSLAGCGEAPGDDVDSHAPGSLDEGGVERKGGITSRGRRPPSELEPPCALSHRLVAAARLT